MKVINPFAHCISMSCDKRLSCRRSLEGKSNVDYIKVDEGTCLWYDQIVTEVGIIGDDVVSEEIEENKEG